MFSRLNRLNKVTAFAFRHQNASVVIPKRANSTFKFEDSETADLRTETAARAITDDLQIADPNDEFADVLDPLNPPRLTYEHVKLIKNIDYSPLIKRARDGGMFTVDDIVKILEETGTATAFKSSISPDHKQDPFVFNETFDVFNKGQKKCPLCLPDPTAERVNRVHYTNVNLLRRYVNGQGMILSRRVTGTCRRHQNHLRYAIKNARALALMSPCSRWQVPVSYAYPDKYDGNDQAAGFRTEITERHKMYKDFQKYGSENPDVFSFDQFVDEHNARVSKNNQEPEL